MISSHDTIGILCALGASLISSVMSLKTASKGFVVTFFQILAYMLVPVLSLVSLLYTRAIVSIAVRHGMQIPITISLCWCKGRAVANEVAGSIVCTLAILGMLYYGPTMSNLQTERSSWYAASWGGKEFGFIICALASTILTIVSSLLISLNGDRVNYLCCSMVRAMPMPSNVTREANEGDRVAIGYNELVNGGGYHRQSDKCVCSLCVYAYHPLVWMTDHISQREGVIRLVGVITVGLLAGVNQLNNKVSTKIVMNLEKFLGTDQFMSEFVKHSHAMGVVIMVTFFTQVSQYLLFQYVIGNTRSATISITRKCLLLITSTIGVIYLFNESPQYPWKFAGSVLLCILGLVSCWDWKSINCKDNGQWADIRYTEMQQIHDGKSDKSLFLLGGV